MTFEEKLSEYNLAVYNANRGKVDDWEGVTVKEQELISHVSALENKLSKLEDIVPRANAAEAKRVTDGGWACSVVLQEMLEVLK